VIDPTTLSTSHQPVEIPTACCNDDCDEPVTHVYVGGEGWLIFGCLKHLTDLGVGV
jgi:hypothetical protein